MPAAELMLQAGLLVGFGLVLAGSAQLVIRAASSFAHKAGITNFAIGFLLLGLLTSTPEIFVAVQSSLDGIPQLSVGNLLGGSILLLSLVIGLSAVFLGRLTLDRGLDVREIAISSAVVSAPAVVLWDGTLTRLEGMALVAIYIFHVFFMKNTGGKKIKHPRFSFRSIQHTLIILVIGFIGMVIASKVMIESAEILIEAWHIPSFVFGLILLSLGTNLPEFSLAFEGAVIRREGVAFGDFLGSAAANTLILGLLGVYTPFEIAGYQRLWFSLILLVILSAYFVWAFSSKREISRREGFGLLLFYLIFLGFEFFGS